MSTIYSTQKALEVVEKVNTAIDQLIGSDTDKQCDEAGGLYLSLSTTGYADSILFMGQVLWDTDSDTIYDDDDNVIDLEKTLIARMREKVASAAKLLTLEGGEDLERLAAGD
jgi:hypothetical protein